MADWRDKYRQGSFRGVEFQVDSHEYSGGRRSQDHEFPQRDNGRSEDVGKRLPHFTLEIFVLGEDYFERRDALISAIEKEGPGELIHPYLGRKVVQAGAFSVRETTQEGRIARFSVEFSDAGRLLFPESVEDETQKTLDNADAVISESKNFFGQAFDLAGAPARLVNAAADLVSGMADQCEASVKKFTQPVAELTYAIRNLKAAAGDLVRNKSALSERMAAVVAQLLSTFEGDEATSEKILGDVATYGDNVAPVIGETPTAVQEATNQAAIVNFTKQQALSNQAKAAVAVVFPSVEKALESRGSIFDGLEVQLEADIGDDLFQKVKDLQASLTETIPAAVIGETVKFTPEETTPALVIAYRLFGSVEKEQEIIDQNAIRHPGFVPGGVEIEVANG